MTDKLTWNDGLSRVAFGKAATNSKRMEWSEKFEADIKELGVDGFADWIKTTLCGPERIYKGNLEIFGYNHQRGEADHDFDGVCYHVLPEQSEEAVTIARNGIAKAIDGIDFDTISFGGLHELLNITSYLGMKDEFEKLLPSVNERLPAIREQAARDQADFERSLRNTGFAGGDMNWIPG